MKVKCIEKKYGNIPDYVYKDLPGFHSEIESVLLTIGETSTVYAMTAFKKNIWYLVFFDGFIYPKYLPNQFFKIVDPRLSKYWIVKEDYDSYDNNNRVLKFTFKEMFENEYFLGELIDDYEEPTKIFAKNKELMDNEF